MCRESRKILDVVGAVYDRRAMSGSEGDWAVIDRPYKPNVAGVIGYHY